MSSVPAPSEVAGSFAGSWSSTLCPERVLTWRVAGAHVELIDFSLVSHPMNAPLRIRFPSQIIPDVCFVEDTTTTPAVPHLYCFVSTSSHMIYRLVFPHPSTCPRPPSLRPSPWPISRLPRLCTSLRALGRHAPVAARHAPESSIASPAPGNVPAPSTAEPVVCVALGPAEVVVGCSNGALWLVGGFASGGPAAAPTAGSATTSGIVFAEHTEAELTDSGMLRRLVTGVLPKFGSRPKFTPTAVTGLAALNVGGARVLVSHHWNGLLKLWLPAGRTCARTWDPTVPSPQPDGVALPPLPPSPAQLAAYLAEQRPAWASMPAPCLVRADGTRGPVLMPWAQWLRGVEAAPVGLPPVPPTVAEYRRAACGTVAEVESPDVAAALEAAAPDALPLPRGSLPHACGFRNTLTALCLPSRPPLGLLAADFGPAAQFGGPEGRGHVMGLFGVGPLGAALLLPGAPQEAPGLGPSDGQPLDLVALQILQGPAGGARLAAPPRIWYDGAERALHLWAPWAPARAAAPAAADLWVGHIRVALQALGGQPGEWEPLVRNARADLSEAEAALDGMFAGPDLATPGPDESPPIRPPPSPHRPAFLLLALAHPDRDPFALSAPTLGLEGPYQEALARRHEAAQKQREAAAGPRYSLRGAPLRTWAEVFLARIFEPRPVAAGRGYVGAMARPAVRLGMALYAAQQRFRDGFLVEAQADPVASPARPGQLAAPAREDATLPAPGCSEQALRDGLRALVLATAARRCPVAALGAAVGEQSPALAATPARPQGMAMATHADRGRWLSLGGGMSLFRPCGPLESLLSCGAGRPAAEGPVGTVVGLLAAMPLARLLAPAAPRHPATAPAAQPLGELAARLLQGEADAALFEERRPAEEEPDQPGPAMPLEADGEQQLAPATAAAAAPAPADPLPAWEGPARGALGGLDLVAVARGLLEALWIAAPPAPAPAEAVSAPSLIPGAPLAQALGDAALQIAQTAVWGGGFARGIDPPSPRFPPAPTPRHGPRQYLLARYDALARLCGLLSLVGRRPPEGATPGTVHQLRALGPLAAYELRVAFLHQWLAALPVDPQPGALAALSTWGCSAPGAAGLSTPARGPAPSGAANWVAQLSAAMGRIGVVDSARPLPELPLKQGPPPPRCPGASTTKGHRLLPSPDAPRVRLLLTVALGSFLQRALGSPLPAPGAGPQQGLPNWGALVSLGLLLVHAGLNRHAHGWVRIVSALQPPASPEEAAAPRGRLAYGLEDPAGAGPDEERVAPLPRMAVAHVAGLAFLAQMRLPQALAHFRAVLAELALEYALKVRPPAPPRLPTRSSSRLLPAGQTVRLMEAIRRPDLALAMAQAALGTAHIQAQPSLMPGLWSAIFKYSVELCDWDQAAVAVLENPDPMRRGEHIRQLVVGLCEQGELRRLVELPWGAQPRGDQGPPLAGPERLGPAAARPLRPPRRLPHLPRRTPPGGGGLLRVGRAGGAEVTDNEIGCLEVMLHGYLGAMNALELVEEADRWLVHPDAAAQQPEAPDAYEPAVLPVRDSPPDLRRLMAHHPVPSPPQMASPSKRKLSLSSEGAVGAVGLPLEEALVTAEDLQAAYAVASAKMELALTTPGGAPPMLRRLNPEDTCALLVRALRFDTAVTVARHHRLSLVPILEALAAHGAAMHALAAAPPTPPDAQPVGTESVLSAAEATALAAAAAATAEGQTWALLRALLESYDGPQTAYDGHAAVCERLLALMPSEPLPRWFVRSFAAAEPPAPQTTPTPVPITVAREGPLARPGQAHPLRLIKILLRYGRVEESQGIVAALTAAYAQWAQMAQPDLEGDQATKPLTSTAGSGAPPRVGTPRRR
ncbi:hypothetical protein PAPYR_4389 [Paratrimastix pyriformis]|uniref:Anaphase-promoting complex subunit 1 n=1 Tax=Paratrimastix pyriformis TaxID=342808 RepID=A0ABQ8UK94_9EUKA|nr:hypothetical protein PAPYR_4389 [Paratrimastix pyriformis]